MQMEEFLNLLKEQGAELSSDADAVRVTHFGDIAAELSAIGERPLIAPLESMGRITATGKDRAKFIHNFCTNDIVSLPSGECREAFFTDVKARILGHGLVAAGETQHDILLLGTSSAALFAHLDRYIIMEDVSLSTGDNEIGFALLDSAEADAESGPNGVSANWKNVKVTLVSVPGEQSISYWQQQLSGGRKPVGMQAFDHLRIRVRYPVIGRDLTSDHLAPEADRVAGAISYTKGCYLGQEPIARLDAMGHINRALRSLRISAPPEEINVGAPISDGKAEVGQVTSVAPAETPQQSLVMSVVRLKDLDGDALQVATRSGEGAQAQLLS